MSVELCIFLFGSPEWEMGFTDNEIESGEMFREKARELYERLNDIAELVDKLVLNGWILKGGMYEIWAYKDVSYEDAYTELVELGVDPKDVILEEIDM